MAQYQQNIDYTNPFIANLDINEHSQLVDLEDEINKQKKFPKKQFFGYLWGYFIHVFMIIMLITDNTEYKHPLKILLALHLIMRLFEFNHKYKYSKIFDMIVVSIKIVLDNIWVWFALIWALDEPKSGIIKTFNYFIIGSIFFVDFLIILLILMVLGVFLYFYFRERRSPTHQKPATLKMIKNHSIVILFSELVGIELDKDCGICLQEYDPNDKVRKLKCNHYFHDGCITEWLITNKVCPLCRNPIDHDIEKNNITIV